MLTKNFEETKTEYYDMLPVFSVVICLKTSFSALNHFITYTDF